MRKRAYWLVCFLCGLAALLISEFAPHFLQGLGFAGLFAHFVAPGFVLLGIVGFVFPMLVLDPFLDTGKMTGVDLMRTVGTVPIVVPLLCILGGSFIYWLVTRL